jgi:hypothetical protein
MRRVTRTGRRLVALLVVSVPRLATVGSSALVAAVLLALAAVPSGARADRGGGGTGPGRGGGRVTDVRAVGVCGKGATSKLRLRQDDAGVKVEFEVDHSRGGEAWQVTLVQEGRVVWRGRASSRGPGGSLSVTRAIGGLSGADRVTARATGPRGITCVASAILPG